MAKSTNLATFEIMSVAKIESGFLIEIDTQDEHIRTAVSSYRQLLKYLKQSESRLTPQIVPEESHEE
jgi:hypothetical protein